MAVIACPEKNLLTALESYKKALVLRHDFGDYLIEKTVRVMYKRHIRNPFPHERKVLEHNPATNTNVSHIVKNKLKLIPAMLHGGYLGSDKAIEGTHYMSAAYRLVRYRTRKPPLVRTQSVSEMLTDWVRPLCQNRQPLPTYPYLPASTPTFPTKKPTTPKPSQLLSIHS